MAKGRPNESKVLGRVAAHEPHPFESLPGIAGPLHVHAPHLMHTVRGVRSTC